MTRPGPWGKAIRDARRSLGLTQAAFGAVVDRSQQVVADWEKGRKVPSDDAKALLIERTGVDPLDVMPDWLRGHVSRKDAA